MIKIFSKFFDFCGKENKRKFYKSIGLGVILAFLETLKIPACFIIITGLIKHNMTTTAIWSAFGIMLVSIIASIFVMSKSTILQTEAGYESCANKRIEIAEHMRYLPMGYFNSNSLGYITSVTTNTMESLADIATRVIMMTTKGYLAMLLITFMMLVYDLRIGLLVVLGFALFIVSNMILQKSAGSLAPRKAASDADLVDTVIEYIHGMVEIKAYAMTQQSVGKLNKAIEESNATCFALEKKSIPYMALQSVVTKGIGVVMAYISIHYWINGSMDAVVCILMLIASFMIYSNLDSVGGYSALMRHVDVAVDKAQQILDLPTMDIAGKDIIPSNMNLEMKNVSLSFNSKKIIDNTSITIKEGTMTAIVGSSGSGKTTICNLFARFWDVDEGVITLGGRNIKEYSMDSLMKNFSFVFQRVYLFEDTIANNIRFGQPDASMENVIAAAKKACCHDFIIQLPNGYDTVIGEGGANLSGGEKQRISIARAIMKGAPIIILDEATANVDPENEKELVGAIEELTSFIY